MHFIGKKMESLREFLHRLHGGNAPSELCGWRLPDECVLPLDSQWQTAEDCKWCSFAPQNEARSRRERHWHIHLSGIYLKLRQQKINFWIIFARLQQAKNIAGAGPVCSLTVNGPVAALVAETDYTFLMFGGGAVIVVMAITIVSMVACRWVRFQTKHPTQSDAIFFRRHSAAKFGTTVISTVRHTEEQPSIKGYYKSQRHDYKSDGKLWVKTLISLGVGGPLVQAFFLGVLPGITCGGNLR